MRVPADFEEHYFHQNGQEWAGVWYPPDAGAPPGKRHGATGVCLTHDGKVVVVSDGGGWGLPGGRPEDDEDWYETLVREVSEEACATILDARLLAYARGTCLRGHEQGLVLVRSIWIATVQLEPWAPAFEIVERAILNPVAALDRLLPFDPNPALLRIFREAFPTLQHPALG